MKIFDDTHVRRAALGTCAFVMLLMFAAASCPGLDAPAGARAFLQLVTLDLALMALAIMVADAIEPKVRQLRAWVARPAISLA